MQQLVGKQVSVIVEEMWGESAEVRGELVAVDERGWVIRPGTVNVHDRLRRWYQGTQADLVYVPQRLIVLASIAD